MEEREKTETKDQEGNERKTMTEPASTDENLTDVTVVGQKPSTEDVACTGIQGQGRPAQNGQDFLTPKQIALILRKLGDDYEKRASERAGNRTEKQG